MSGGSGTKDTGTVNMASGGQDSRFLRKVGLRVVTLKVYLFSKCECVYVHLCSSVCVCHMSAGVLGGQEELAPVGLNQEGVGSHVCWEPSAVLVTSGTR